MSVVIDSNAPYFTEFPLKSAGDAVYMTAEDEFLGHVFAVVYRAHRGNPKLSVILIGAHGTSGYVDMTLDRTSRYFGACRGLAPAHYKSPVRRALAIAVLRTYATVDKPLRQRFRGLNDEAAAGALGSRFRLVYGKFPGAIGTRMLDAGLISPKRIEASVIDIVYEDSDDTIDDNNELVYLLGEQLEQLFDPLSEYSPEPTERLYTPPNIPPATPPHTSSLDAEPREVQDLCEELYLLQAHARGDILDMLQTLLIPLRVEVLKGTLPNLSIARLNSVFPPTIDELFRVNNLFYESLRLALPYGAFEVVKACGATIPYFFRACMRHEAATQNFDTLLADLLAEEPEVRTMLMRSGAVSGSDGSNNNRNIDMNHNGIDDVERKIERVIHNSTSHLSAIKRCLDRLLSAKKWSSADEQHQVDEFYAVASGTVDAFTRKTPPPQAVKSASSRSLASPKKNNNKTNNNNDNNAAARASAEPRKLATAGKILGEITQDWPTELEYGWISRRVVSVFDAVDVLEPDETLRQLHTVFIVFTDALVVCRPSEPIQSTSLSGLHIPSVGDMLMHAMLNEAPLDKKLPPLRVLAWAPILDVNFASYDRQHLFVFSPGIVGSYRLLQPDSDSNALVTLLAKAKITTKTQPFHLFKVSGRETTIFSTVQELEGYREEANRTNIALFLSTPISERTLSEYGLVGAMSLHMKPGDADTVVAKVVSRMRYSGSFEVSKEELQDLVVNELAYLMTLSLSSQNQAMLDVIIMSNKLVANRLIKWASQPEVSGRGHKTRRGIQQRHLPPQPKSSSSSAKLGPMRWQAPAPPAQSLQPRKERQAAKQEQIKSELGQQEEPQQEDDESQSRLLIIPSESADSLTGAGTGPNASKNGTYLRRIPGTIPASARDFQASETRGGELDRDPEIFTAVGTAAAGHGPSYSVSSEYSEVPSDSQYTSIGGSSLNSSSSSIASMGVTSGTDISLEEAEQRDVDNWYHQLNNGRRDDESLSSSHMMSDADDLDIGSGGVPVPFSMQRSRSNSHSIQIGGFFMDRTESNLYNQNAGRAFPRIESDGDGDGEGSESIRSNMPRGPHFSHRSLLNTDLPPPHQYESSRFDSANSTIASAAAAGGGAATSSRSRGENHRRQETESSFETINSLQDSIGGESESSMVSGNTTLSNIDARAAGGPADGGDVTNNVEDFSYLASLVDATSFASKLSELDRGVYPDLRETSLVRLGSYILRTDKSQRDVPNFSLDTIPESAGNRSTAYEDADATPTLHSGKFSAVVDAATAAAGKKDGSYTPFADVETADWHPRVVKSGTTSTVSGLLPGSRDKAAATGTTITVDFEDADDLDGFTDEDGYELAKQYLAWAESSGRPISVLSTKNISDFLNESPKRRSISVRSKLNAIPESKSQMSFHRMVMSSSLHTLQLASFVVQIDQKELTSSKELATQLSSLKDYISSVYRLRVTTVESELVIRTQLTGYFFLLMKYECQQLATGLLEIEWYRRTRISELHPDLPPQLWKFEE